MLKSVLAVVFVLLVEAQPPPQSNFQIPNPFNIIPKDQPKAQTKNPIMAMAEDPIMFDKFDMKQFLCSSCRFLVSASKKYYQINPNTQQLVEFLNSQRFYEDLKESCQREFEKSGARAGKFFGCQTVLIQSITEIQQKLAEIGQGLPKENNQICFEKMVGVCKTGILSSIIGK